MQAVIRTYSGKGAKELFGIVEKHTADVEKLLCSVNGFVGYTLARSGDGGFSMRSAKTRQALIKVFKSRRIGSQRMQLARVRALPR